jgi:hypothetical protein
MSVTVNIFFPILRDRLGNNQSIERDSQQQTDVYSNKLNLNHTFFPILRETDGYLCKAVRFNLNDLSITQI